MDGVSSATGVEIYANYAFSVADKAMETTEDLAQNMVEMIKQANPSAQAAQKGAFIDVLV